MTKLRDQLVALLEPPVVALGYELVDLEANLGGRGGTLRLYIDRPEGVGLEDCERVSQQVSGILDVEDPIRGDYNLEVSSPGLDRKLVKSEHFDRFAGQQVTGRLKRLVDGRRRFTGRLVGRSGRTVTVAIDGQECGFELDDIDMVRLVPDLSAGRPQVPAPAHGRSKADAGRTNVSNES